MKPVLTKGKNQLRRLIARELERRVKRLINEQGVKVVAVTGSVGKTTTKLAIASVLGQKYRVLAHPGNYNSEIGLPMSIFELEVPGGLTNPIEWIKVMYQIDRKLEGSFPYDVLVLEMGADAPNDIQKFMRYITPDIGVVTAIAPTHIEQFGSVDAVAQEKMALARGSKAVWLNAEDHRVMEESKRLGKPVQTFGVEKGTVHFDDLRREKALTFSGRLQLQNGEVGVKTHVIGKHSLAALAIAGAMGEELGLEPDEISKGIEAFKPVDGRMRVFVGSNGSMVIDDTYNSSPRATIAAIETLGELPGRKIAILGSMNELGAETEAGHRSVGRAAANVDALVTIGSNANRYLVAGAIEKGMAENKIHTFASPFAAGEFVKTILKTGDVVLAKGSQNGVFAEEAVAKILADPADREHLVRQSAEWQKRKRAQFDDASASHIHRYIQQSFAEAGGYRRGEQACVPTAFYTLAIANGYISESSLSLNEFVKNLNWDEDFVKSRGWIRPYLTRTIRERHQIPIVSWMTLRNQRPTTEDIAAMHRSGYLGSEAEQSFFEQQVVGNSLKQIVNAGYPIIVGVKPGFGANQNDHAIIIVEWKGDMVRIIDPDGRNDKVDYDEQEILDNLNPLGACSVVLPKA